nr:hypothetical protein [Tanacetum cinerariifolium]GEW86619.1 hypothetical protein [Tanacetum cinerariifolium]
MMNELVRNKCIVTNHQVNVQFLLQLKPKWKRSQDATSNKRKEIANIPLPIYDSKPKVVSDEESTPMDKEIEKLMDLISKSFKKNHKPTNNNLRTSSNTKNKNVDNTLRFDRRNGAVNVVGAMENVGIQLVHQTGIQCFNCKEFGHVATECKKAKWVKDSAYHKEKMMLCKQEEDGIELSVEQVDWKDETYDEPEVRN